MPDSAPRPAAAAVAWLLAGLSGLLYLTLGLIGLAGGGGAQDPGLLLGLVVSGAMAILLLILGWGLAMGAGRRFAWSAGRGIALLVLCLAGGAATLASGLGPVVGLLMPVWHLAGVLLPALTILAWARGRAPAAEPGPPPAAELSWRAVTGGLAWGGCAASLVAIVLEGVAALFLVLGLAVALGDDPAWQDLWREISLQSGAAPDPEAQRELLLGLAQNPWIVGAGLVMMAVLAPLFEELSKVLGMTFAPAALAAGGARGAWLRGLALGAGFGVFEGLFYAGMALTPVAWAGAILLRACATFMHATVTGLAALGWWRARRGRWASALALLVAAILGHGLWNGLAVGAVVASLRSGGDAGGRPTGLVAAALAGGVIVLFYAMVTVFGLVSRRLGAGVGVGDGAGVGVGAVAGDQGV